jgi:hypothetical protein
MRISEEGITPERMREEKFMVTIMQCLFAMRDDAIPSDDEGFETAVAEICESHFLEDPAEVEAVLEVLETYRSTCLPLAYPELDTTPKLEATR